MQVDKHGAHIHSKQTSRTDNNKLTSKKMNKKRIKNYGVISSSFEEMNKLNKLKKEELNQ